MWCGAASRVAPRPSQICRPNAEMGLVAVGRFFENPIQNNFSGIDSRHRNPRPRKSRGIDVGGYMRERVWSWETGEGHPTSISAAGARREAVAGAIRRMRPLNAARRRGGSLLKRPLGVAVGARRGASCRACRLLAIAAARPPQPRCSSFTSCAPGVEDGVFCGVRPPISNPAAPASSPVPSLNLGEGRDGRQRGGRPSSDAGGLAVDPVGLGDRSGGRGSLRAPAVAGAGVEGWLPSGPRPLGARLDAGARCTSRAQPLQKTLGRRDVPYLNRPSSRGPLCSLVGDTPRSRRIMAAANHWSGARYGACA